MVRAEGGGLRFWGPGLLSTSPAFSMSSASHSAGSSGWLAHKKKAGPAFQWAGKVDAICRSRSNRAKRPRAGCILRSYSPTCSHSSPLFKQLQFLNIYQIIKLQATFFMSDLLNNIFPNTFEHKFLPTNNYHSYKTRNNLSLRAHFFKLDI